MTGNEHIFGWQDSHGGTVAGLGGSQDTYGDAAMPEDQVNPIQEEIEKSLSQYAEYRGILEELPATFSSKVLSGELKVSDAVKQAVSYYREHFLNKDYQITLGMTSQGLLDKIKILGSLPHRRLQRMDDFIARTLRDLKKSEQKAESPIERVTEATAEESPAPERKPRSERWQGLMKLLRNKYAALGTAGVVLGVLLYSLLFGNSGDSVAAEGSQLPDQPGKPAEVEGKDIFLGKYISFSDFKAGEARHNVDLYQISSSAAELAAGTGRVSSTNVGFLAAGEKVTVGGYFVQNNPDGTQEIWLLVDPQDDDITG